MLRTRALAVFVVASSVAVGLPACTSSKDDPPERVAAQRFLDAVGSADISAAAARTDNSSEAAQDLRASLAGLGSGTRGTLRVRQVTTDDGRGTARFDAAWTLPGVSSKWTYRGSFALQKQGKQWQVVWRDNVLHPNLGSGMHLAVQRVQPKRAALEDRDGTPLFVDTQVVRVGIEKSLVKDLGALAGRLAAVPELQSTAKEIIASVRDAAPTAFIPVVTLRRAVYERIRPKIYDLAGTVFQSSTVLLPPSPHFAQPMLGSVGPATDELVRASDGRLRPGDQTGLGGLQQAFDKTLAGTAGTAVYSTSDGGAGLDTRLSTVQEPRSATPVRLSIDRSVQAAAEAALASVKQQASIVAIQPSTGRILADANSAAATYDLGLAGAVPPGSTFKIVTYTAAFTAKPSLTAATQIACPATKTVDGRRFENEDRFQYPPLPLSAAFGYSCNTSAITQGLSLPTGALASAATALGLGATWKLPVEAFSGSVPVPATETERAADAIGQGRVQVSPLLMALVAGAARTGNPVTPSLAAAQPGQRGAALPASVTEKMNALMQATVILPKGTGHELADLGDVRGKTGTAEYGNAKPPRSHSWFAGTRGDLAFAVFVYDGASAGVKAVPITHEFLSAVK